MQHRIKFIVAATALALPLFVHSRLPVGPKQDPAQQVALEAPGFSIFRITSYNVCYTKLLRTNYGKKDEHKQVLTLQLNPDDSGFSTVGEVEFLKE